MNRARKRTGEREREKERQTPHERQRVQTGQRYREHEQIDRRERAHARRISIKKSIGVQHKDHSERSSMVIAGRTIVSQLSVLLAALTSWSPSTNVFGAGAISFFFSSSSS